MCLAVWAEHWHWLLCWYGTVHARGRAGLDELACSALTVIENVTVTVSHIAKGREIEARHRLVPAVGIMRLVVWPGAARTAVELCLHWWH